MANGTEQRRSGDQNKWNEMLSMLAMANRTTPQTLLGFGLGRLLRNYYRSEYDKRERLKGEQGATELEQGGANSAGQNDTAEAAQARYEDALLNGYGDLQATSRMPESMEMTGGQRGKGANPVPPGSADDVLVRDGLLGGDLPMRVDTDWLNRNDTSKWDQYMQSLEAYSIPSLRWDRFINGR